VEEKMKINNRAVRILAIVWIVILTLFTINESWGQEDCGPLDFSTIRDMYSFVAASCGGTVGGRGASLILIRANHPDTNPQQAILYGMFAPDFSILGYAVMSSDGLEYYRYL
jgi:hypothetical protein